MNLQKTLDNFFDRFTINSRDINRYESQPDSIVDQLFYQLYRITFSIEHSSAKRSMSR